MQHAHHEWLATTAHTMAGDYDRLRTDAAASASNIQQVGHGGEASWVQFFVRWLPPGYAIGRRKYILPENGGSAFETDLVIFNKGYPAALREEERVLASGVAAAFSVKLTANAAGLREAAESAVTLSRGLKPRLGNPRQELLRPFPFAYLAHSHSWKADASTPTENVTRNMDANDVDLVKHPRESLDAVCIGDLGFWRQIKSPYIPAMKGLGAGASVTTANLALTGSQDDPLPPVAMLLSWLYERLALTDPSLAELAAGFRLMGTGGEGQGQMRQWSPTEVFSEEVSSQLSTLAFGRGGRNWESMY